MCLVATLERRPVHTLFGGLETLEGQAVHSTAWTTASFRCWLQTLWFESARRA